MGQNGIFNLNPALLSVWASIMSSGKMGELDFGRPPSGRKPILIDEDRRTRQGAWLLIASLGIFFFSSMLLYVIYIWLRVKEGSGSAPLNLPASFFWSTAILLAISALLHVGVGAAKRDEGDWLIRVLGTSFFLSIVFFAVQGDAMYWLLRGMNDSFNATTAAYSLTFVLAFVHAMHVVGGLVSLGIVLRNAIRRSYDHERWWAVQFCALYWHFLDIVWLIMLGSFYIASRMMN